MEQKKFNGFKEDFQILPIGKVNLKNGNTDNFNIYEIWGEDTTYEIYETFNKGNKIVAVPGTKPKNELGVLTNFVNAQTGRNLWSGKMVDYAVGSDLKDLVQQFGNGLMGYNYK